MAPGEGGWGVERAGFTLYVVTLIEIYSVKPGRPTLVRARVSDLHQLVGALSGTLGLDAYYTVAELALALAGPDPEQVGGRRAAAAAACARRAADRFIYGRLYVIYGDYYRDL
jgi:hypothetical protein